MTHTRRHFLQAATGAGLVGCWGDWSALCRLSLATAADAEVTPDLVQLDPTIEPIVRLIEETPREKCFEMMTGQLKAGLPYRHFLAALFLAGLRNVNPQPPGFKFHCVFVIYAAHQLSAEAPVQERLLPLFWALDAFKQSQAEDVAQGDFKLRPVTGTLPSPERAWSEFHAAMEDWDEPRADRAIVSLVRSRGANEIIEGLWKYGARDYRNIGHKAIFVANTWRTLQTIGWQHAETALRSLVLGLLDFGRQERVNEYAFEDQSYLANLRKASEAAPRLPGDWSVATANTGATTHLLEILREGDLNAVSDEALSQLVAGKARASAIWDAAHLAAGELMMRQPGIYGIHTVTSVNGLRYAYETSADPETRLVLLLQGLGWMAQFRNFMASRPAGLKETRINELQAAEIPAAPDKAAVDIFETVSEDVTAAARQAFAYGQKFPATAAFSEQVRQLVFTKGTDAHHYKYAAAILEDVANVSPVWRPHQFATTVYYVRGRQASDSVLMQRAKESLATL